MNNKQTTDTIMMIRPFKFGFNASTSKDNVYQNSFKKGVTCGDVSEQAIVEFDRFVDLLKSAGVNVVEFRDNGTYETPDSIFPNNWISTHADGSIWLYPMCSTNRRVERRQDIIDFLKNSFHVKNIFNNASVHELNNQFLEGTGSMVLDRENQIAYASLSQRTNCVLFKDWCKKMNFEPVFFQAQDSGKPIYHTNVLMSICQDMVFICLDAICEPNEKDKLLSFFHDTGKEIIDISKSQMNSFLGNVLELKNNDNEPILVMSSSAFNVLTVNQKVKMNKKYTIIHSSLKTIEYFGGGSARCMITELFLDSNYGPQLKHPILS